MAVAGALVPARVGVHGGARQHPAPARGQAPGPRARPGLGSVWAECPTFPRGRELKTELGSQWHF